MPLNQAQQNIKDVIINYGRENGFSKADILCA